MNWLTNYVRPKLKALVGQKNDMPENLWHKCSSCGQMLFHRDLKENLFICMHCENHLRVTPKQRFDMLFDEGKYETIDPPRVALDPLKFKDTKKYSDRLKSYQEKTQSKDVLHSALGTIHDKQIMVSAFDFSFMGGSMGMAVGESIVKAITLAVQKKVPYLIIPASGGARMQEGILSLMQMPRTIAAVKMLKKFNLPYFVLLTNPTTGGVTASFAMLGDVTLAEPNAVIGFAGVRVIQQTIRGQLPEGFQTSEYLKDHGMIDSIVDRKNIRLVLSNLMSHLYYKKGI